LPVFQFSKAFGVGRGLRAFLNLEAVLTRGTPAKTTQSRERGEAPRNARQLVKKQRKTLKGKDREIRRQARDLRTERKRNHKNRRKLRQRESEIFQLRNELAAMKRLAETTRDVPGADEASVEPEVGALPDFVIIRAQKGGTTQFYRLLTLHPDIARAAIKETHYFDRPENFSKGIEWYRRCFPPPGRDGRRFITGEATPAYLVDPAIPERMAEVVPEARLIALLRNPADRAYSQYHMAIRNGNEPRSFEEALEEEQAWLLGEGNGLSDHERDSRANRQRLSSYLRMGLYVDQLLRWRRFFNDEQMLVLKSEDFFERPLKPLKLAHDFLGLPHREPEIRPRGAKHGYEPMNPSTRQRLEDFFEPHNHRLYELLGADLGW